MKKVIILNGPAGCGKDTLAGIIAELVSVDIHSNKVPLFEVARAMLGETNYNKFIRLYNDRETKERPASILGGMSPRKFFIHLSESVIKPIFGQLHFGQLLADRVERSHSHAVVSDGGFPDEVRPLIEAGFDVYVVRLHSHGYDFAGDSRGYIHLPALLSLRNYHEIDFHQERGEPINDALKLVKEIFK
ncbi:hypothetical protein [Gibbsiella quercinecans]|uniref:hypothetical protein n=1 Tax=Gibbsiella quercinecans TaxID=929813 RepID=UPI00242DB162|nr:hypothetical protein [Gibbsiella quercinecans]